MTTAAAMSPLPLDPAIIFASKRCNPTASRWAETRHPAPSLTASTASMNSLIPSIQIRPSAIASPLPHLKAPMPPDPSHTLTTWSLRCLSPNISILTPWRTFAYRTLTYPRRFPPFITPLAELFPSLSIACAGVPGVHFLTTMAP